MNKTINSLKICILQSYYSGEPLWNYRLEQYLKKMGFQNISKFIIRRNSIDELLYIESIINKGFDIYFNICDGSTGVYEEAGTEVARYLSYANVPFIGPDISCYQPSRERMKNVCIQNDIKTPAYKFIYDLQKDFQKLNVLKFPLIVKHYNSAGSSGLTIKSKVTQGQELRKQLQIMLNQYGGSLVQQFIQGRQFTCLVMESGEQNEQPFAYEPVEFTFKNPLDDFKYEEIKMTGYRQMQVCDIANKQIRDAIKQISIKFFKAMKMMSYARVDLRMNAQNQLYILQINPVPSMFYCREQAGSGDQIIYRSEGGHSAFIERLIKSALLKHKNKKSEISIDAKKICLKEMNKEKKAIDMKLPRSEQVKVLLNLYFQSLSENNQYRAGLSKESLQILKKEENREIEYVFNQQELRKLES